MCVDMEGHVLFFCRSRELFVGKSVWRFLFEGDELGDFCKGFDVKCSYYVDDYWDNVYICFECAMVLEGLFKQLVDGAYVLMTSCMFPSVEYLHSMSCSSLLPWKVGSLISLCIQPP